MNKHTEVEEYFRAARDLGIAIRANRADTEFGQGPRKVVYLADTNVAEAFLRDTSILRDKRAGGASSSVSNLMTPKAAELSDRLAYRYIFSGQLPGESESDAVYVSQPHWDELLRRARKIGGEVEAGGSGNLTAEELAELRALRDNPAELIAKAEEVGFDRIADEIRRATSLGRRINSAFVGSQRKIVPLDHSPYWENIFDSIRANDLRRWMQLLTLNRRRSHDREESENIEADAKTLAMIEALYREHPAAIGPDARIRFVFITFDAAIRRAFRKRHEELAREGIPYFVRHPLVYHPLLNFSAMHEATATRISASEEVRQIFFDVEDAIAALFQTKEDASTIAASDQQSNLHLDLMDNIERWSGAAEKISIANARLFADESDEAEEGREIASYFDKEDVLAAAGRAVHAAIATIEQNHAQALSTLTLDRLLRWLREERSPGRERRTPLRIPESVDVLQRLRVRSPPDLAQIRTLDDLLESIFATSGEKRPPTLIDSISQVLETEWGEADIQLLATGIFMAAGLWDSAQLCADQCIHLARGRDMSGVISREARYCKALSLRMMLRSKREVRIARETLNENLSIRRSDPLIWIRDAVERSTLILSACIVQTIEKVRPASSGETRDFSDLIRPSELHNSFDKEVAELDEALRDLANDFLGSSSKENALVAGVTGQAAVNRLGAELFRLYFAQEISNVRADLEAVYAKSRDFLTDVEDDYAKPLMARAYLGVAELELGIADGSAGLVAMLEGAQNVTDLAEGDEAEYWYFRTRITSKLMAGLERAAATGAA